MYKIFLGDKVIYLCNDLTFIFQKKEIKRIKYTSKANIHKQLRAFQKNKKLLSVIVFYSDLEKLWKKFQSDFTIIEAAGGLVKNKNKELLFIFRNDKWDLPKGKIEPNETIENAAIREVEEECGISNLKIVRPLTSTYHIYELNKKLVLKKTYWFGMSCSGKPLLTPQKQEGITKAKWVKLNDLKEIFDNTYETIKEIFGI